MPNRFRDNSLLLLMAIFIAGAVWTALPGNPSKPNDLGYYSICPFAPWSTLTFLLVAAVLYVVRRYFQTRPKLQQID